MSALLIKQLSIIVTIAVWFNVHHGKAIGCVLNSPMLLKSVKNGIEVYGKDDHGRELLQMMIMFARQPQVYRHRTEIISSQPQLDTLSTDYIYTKPQIDSLSTDYIYTQPQIDSLSTDYIYAQPQIDSLSTDYIYTQPQVDSISTEYIYTESQEDYLSPEYNEVANDVDTRDICEIENSSIPPTACREGFIPLPSGKCFMFVTEKKTWAEAKAACNGHKATLAHPMNPSQNQAIATHLHDKFSYLPDGWYMGGTDKDHEGEWIWSDIDCPIKYTDYYPTQPDNTGNLEDCLHYTVNNNEWKWNDINCDYSYPFICQQ